MILDQSNNMITSYDESIGHTIQEVRHCKYVHDEGTERWLVLDREGNDISDILDLPDEDPPCNPFYFSFEFERYVPFTPEELAENERKAEEQAEMESLESILEQEE